MAHIFLSYMHDEKAYAARLAGRLTEAGFDVWWDDALVAGQDFDNVIQKVIEATPAAVILWSRAAARSDWVRAEANIARQQKTAIPVIIDDVPVSALPIPFQQLHMITLQDWDGNPEDKGFKQLLKAIVERVGRPAADPSPAASGLPAGLVSSAEDAALWADVVKSNEEGDYREYIKKVGPNGPFVKMAELRLARAIRRRRRRQALAAAAVGLVIALSGVALLRPSLFPPEPTPVSVSSADSQTASSAPDDQSIYSGLTLSSESSSDASVATSEPPAPPIDFASLLQDLSLPDLPVASSEPSTDPSWWPSLLFASSSVDVSSAADLPSDSSSLLFPDPRCGSLTLIRPPLGIASFCLDTANWTAGNDQDSVRRLYFTSTGTGGALEFGVDDRHIDVDQQEETIRVQNQQMATTTGTVRVTRHDQTVTDADGHEWTVWDVERPRANDIEYTREYFYSDAMRSVFLQTWSLSSDEWQTTNAVFLTVCVDSLP